jgi:hypothetical protein
MRTQEVAPDRRPVGYSATPVTVVDPTGREIATVRSPRKLAKAIVAGELVLIAGDTVHIGKHVVGGLGDRSNNRRMSLLPRWQMAITQRGSK